MTSTIRGSEMYWAIRDKNYPLLTRLLKSRTRENINDLDDPNGWASPIHLACYAKDLTAMQLILDKGGDANLISARNGWSPLFCLVTQYELVPAPIECVCLLIRAGADVDYRVPARGSQGPRGVIQELSLSEHLFPGYRQIMELIWRFRCLKSGSKWARNVRVKFLPHRFKSSPWRPRPNYDSRPTIIDTSVVETLLTQALGSFTRRF